MKLRQSLCGLAVAAFLAAAPAWADISDSVNVKTTEFDLPNGLHVILSEDHTLPRVAVNVLYKVGSSDEAKGRTGFAHLFEHLMMYSGSGHVGKGQFNEKVEKAGGHCNAYTSEDYTDYYMTLPAEALPMALFMESDRMGYFTESMRENIVDEQRDVVKNEMRQRFLNYPYAVILLELPHLLYPEGHPYSWPIIGSMDDLSAAQLDDVVGFFKDHYTPGSASLAIVGDFDTAEAKKMVEHWFSDVPKCQAQPRAESKGVVTPQLNGVVKFTLTDKKAQLPYRHIVWHTPGKYQEGNAACDVLAGILTGSIYSRLSKRLEYDQKMTNALIASQESRRLSSVFSIGYLALPGYDLDEIQAIIDEEIARISQEPPTQKEIDLVVNGMKLRYYDRIQEFNSLAEKLNLYYFGTGQADYFNQDLERYSRVTPQEISDCAKRYLRRDNRVEVTALPETASSAQIGSDNGAGKEAK